VSGWWRRNAVPLVATAVLLPATFLIIGGSEWNEYFSGRPTQPMTARPGESVEVNGVTWGPASIEQLDPPADAELPADAVVYRVTIEVRPADEAVACLPPSLHELEGAQREWGSGSYEVGWAGGSDSWDSCPIDATEPFTIVVPYLVPADAAGPFAVDIEGADLIPAFPRLVVEP
jgi:hypothetical protein